MTKFKLATAIAISTLFVVGAVPPTHADDAHHPAQGAVAQQPATTPLGPGGMMGPGSMMGGGHMMGSGGMMGPGGMMGMMGGGGMMGMMGGGGMMMHGRGMGGMHMFDHIEGKIAFLRAELKITDAQAPAWNTLAEALRASAKRIADVRAATMPAAAGATPTAMTFPDRLDRYERQLAARLESVRAIKAALAPLYASLSDEQKKTAEEILRPRMGMMGMGGPNR